MVSSHCSFSTSYGSLDKSNKTRKGNKTLFTDVIFYVENAKELTIKHNVMFTLVTKKLNTQV